MRFGLLGSVDVVDASGRPVDIGGRQPRIALGLLLLADGRPVTPDALVDAIWGATPPASAGGTLQSYVSRLRRALEPLGATLRYDESGYVLDRGGIELDIARFEELAEQGRRSLTAGDAAAARAALVEAEALWRGPALTELRDVDAATGASTRLDELRLVATEDRLAADLALGRHELVIGELSGLASTYPLREGVHAKLALALYRAGRQAEAVRALARAGHVLREELGIDPGRALRDLEGAILAQDPSLDLPVPAAADPTRARLANGDDAIDSSDPDHASDVAPSGPGAARPLAGRARELDELLAAWREASTGDGRIAVVEGEPGIGKTRVAEAVGDAVASAGGTVVWGRCDEGGAAPALWPWLDPLRALARDGAAATEVNDLLSAHPLPRPDDQRPGGAVGAGRYTLLAAMAEVIERAAAQRPLLVVLDDLQWADETSLELLALLASRPGRRWMVLVTMRRLEVGRSDQLVDTLATIARRPGTRRLQLRGLDRDDTVRMLGAVAGVGADLAAVIHDRAEGNPFYAIELAQLGADGDQSVPAGVGDVVRRRIAQLPAPTAELLGVAAVCGRDVDVSFLVRCAELDLGAVLDHLDPAVVHRLLLVDDDHPTVVRFSHALVREVLLDGLTALRRARLHLRVADAMEQLGEAVERLSADEVEIHAEHLWRAAPAGAGRRAAEALERAAEVALRRLSFTAAESQLRRAVELRRVGGRTDDDAREQLRTLERLLGVIVATRYYQGADRELVDLARQLAERLGEHDLLRQLLYYEASALQVSTRLDEAEPIIAELLALTNADDRPHVRATGHEKRAVQLWSWGRVAEAVAEIDLAAALHAQSEAEAGPSAGHRDPLSEEQRVVTRMFWLLLHGLHGDLSADEVIAAFDAAIAAAPDRASASPVCGFGATTATALGRWDAAERYRLLASDDERASQFAFWDGQLRMIHGVLLGLDGDPDVAVAALEDGRERYVAVAGRSSLASVISYLAMHLADRGELDHAARLVAEARLELDRYGELWNEPNVLAAEAALAAARGDDAGASATLADAVALAEAQGSHGLAARLATRVASSPAR